MAGGIAWKLQRLRSMSPAEIAWRIEQRLALRVLARRAGRPVPALPRPEGSVRAALERSSAVLVSPALATGPRGAAAEAFDARHPGETARLIARADAVLAGRLERFARTTSFGPDPARWPWNKGGDDGPDIAPGFGPALDYRDPDVVGDARLAWELGRFGFLAAPAQAAWRTDDPRYAHFVFAAIEAFCEACPPYRGIQWVSALEFALRSLSWGFALALVARTSAGAAIEEARWERVLATWAEQLRFVARHDARFSSANNHRLGEAAGLAWGGMALGFLPEAKAWRERGLAVLEECVLAQTTPDGVTREHAFQYQHFVLDFAVAVEAAAVRSGRAMPGAVRERIAAIADTLDWFAPGGDVWAVGDGDEGQALPLGESFAERAAASLEAARGLVGGADVRERAPLHPRSTWLGLPGAAPSPPRAGRIARGGYVVEAWTTPWGEARLLFDAAAMGLPPLYAHGHADALMLLLDVGGPRLVDPGTGAYHARPDLREWLRSTAAHNTLELDGRSQSAPGGLFQWLRVARVFDVALGAGAMGAAHDGYAAGPEGVVHRRSIERTGEATLEVVDRLEPLGAAAPCRAVVRWHVGDGRAVVTNAAGDAPARARVMWPDGFAMTLEARLPAGGSARGHADATWSPRFLEPRPCGVVEWIVEAVAPFEIGTRITLDGRAGR